jgi:anti-sigma factor RsiW
MSDHPMTDHLSAAILNALADGELSAEELSSANEHLGSCASCTGSALYQTLLKAATARAGRRYFPPPHLLERLTHQKLHSAFKPGTQASLVAGTGIRTRRFPMLAWAAAAAVLLVSVTVILVQRNLQRTAMVASANAALVTEVCDQHIATLADSLPPQVLSSDKHTVKPWFQGRIPFSFNLPESLPRETKLDGANLSYLRNQPVAQLLYSVGKHRVSVFVTRRPARAAAPVAEHSGFHVVTFTSDDLEVIAVSDVEEARLSELVNAIGQAQTGSSKP